MILHCGSRGGSPFVSLKGSYISYKLHRNHECMSRHSNFSWSFPPPFHHTYVVHGWPFMIFSPFDIFILFKVGTMKYSTIEWISFFNRNKCTITLYTNLIPWKVSHRCINCIFQKKDRKLDAETFLGLWI